MRSIAILLLAGVLPLAAQWLDYHDARTPRTRDGKPNLTAAPPRVNGKPELSGGSQRTPPVWLMESRAPSPCTQASVLQPASRWG